MRSLDATARRGHPPPPTMRVIAGQFGGRRLHAPHGSRTRPTSDRVREALFMRLEPLAGAIVVDLYAGSGALGIEALSRGAAFAHFVEPDRHALEALRSNLEVLGLGNRSRVWPLRLPGGLGRLAGALGGASLVLADPPYGGEDAQRVLTALGRAGVLGDGARVVLERHAKDVVSDHAGTLACVDSRRYGETVVDIYRAAEPDAGGRA